MDDKEIDEMSEQDKKMLMDIFFDSLHKNIAQRHEMERNQEGIDKAFGQLFNLYSSAVKAGFSEEQAFQLIVEMSKSAMQLSPREE